MSEEPPSRSLILPVIVVLSLVGGGWYFLRHYQISGLDKVTVSGKQTAQTEHESIVWRDDLAGLPDTEWTQNRLTLTHAPAAPSSDQGPAVLRRLRIATWALDGLVAENLADDVVRTSLVRVIRQFDILAVQQVTSKQRNLLPRILAAVNAGDSRYQLVVDQASGPSKRLAFLFNTARLQVDRSQIYTVSDPHHLMSCDPLVAWFRTLGPDARSAWTFSLVNVHIDLEHAQQEVALLPGIMASVRFDGRGEDDVILAGLFQADDAYLLATLGVRQLQAAALSTSTDIFGKHQVSNLLLDSEATSEFVGQAGVLDFLRVFNLSIDEAKAVSAQLPVYAEFAVVEGGAF